ncbi:hypothetical protein FRC02_006025 [Tulasnella sp. 418]|nr:hypothetical protein FRC02_006025 [Tulasnella sp. 418]
MAPLRSRSQSPAYPSKKAKTDTQPVLDCFALGLLSDDSVRSLRNEYNTSEPYKYCKIDQLFDHTLLKNVKDEILKEIRFTEKETDIYKVHQTGDLASLSYLTPEQLKLFPSLTQLRDALYSVQFRQFIRDITGCGPLSGSKQDMSVNSYKKGCHLLNHDDVIGTRRVSYILYLPLPETKPWLPEYGGALELYPVTPVGPGELEPLPSPSKVIPPSWNQFILFEVQPGHSFHSVEEVVVGTDEDGRQRLSISGWFHKPQEGEEGYLPEDPNRQMSSLEQLSIATTNLKPYHNSSAATSISASDVSFLEQFLNPIYVQAKTIEKLAARFADESSIELHSFLSEQLGKTLEDGLRIRDTTDGYINGARGQTVPKHTSGLGGEGDWVAKGPPHKQRYTTPFQQTDHKGMSISSSAMDSDSPTAILNALTNDLLPSAAFRNWLAAISSLVPSGHYIEARRFRPGLDYTLARSEEKGARLDVVLGLTPRTDKDKWDEGQWGGWQVSLAFAKS